MIARLAAATLAAAALLIATAPSANADVICIGLPGGQGICLPI